MVTEWFFYYLVPIANALAQSCVVMVVTRDNGLELGIAGDASGAKRHMLDDAVQLVVLKGRQSSVPSLVSAWSAFRRLRAFRPDIVHAQDHTDWRLLLLTATCGAHARLLTVHDVVTHLGKRETSGFHAFVRRLVRRLSDAYVVHGEYLAQLLRAQTWYRAGQRVFVIPHGALAVPASASPLPDTPSLLLFGRLEYYKGVDVFVQAAELAAESLPGLRAIIAGRGPEVERCARFVTHPELFEWRTGFVQDDDLPSLFAESSVVILPYREASQSGVVPMAFMNGRAVIATKVGGLPEAIEDGVDGLLVEPDDPAGLAAAIIQFHTTLGLAARLTERAGRVVENGRCSAARIAAEHLRAYEILLGASNDDCEPSQ
jgi:glycosyltransferase involved in cell wall biosynthesis